MPNWTAFTGVAGAVLVAILFLTRLSAVQFRTATSRDGPSAGDASVESPLESDGESATGAFDGHPPTRDGRSHNGIERSGRHDDSQTDRSGRHDPSGDREPGRSTRGGPIADDGHDDPGRRSDSDVLAEMTPLALLANVALTQGSLLVVLLGAAAYFEIPWAAFGADASLRTVGVGIAFGVAFYGGNRVASALADVAGAGYDERLRGALAPDSIPGWVVLLGVVLPVIAAFEELLFRGAVIGVVSAGFEVSPWLLAGASSLLFGLAHSAQGRVGMIVTGVFGVAFAVAYIATGSLLVVVVAHYVLNGLEFVVHEGIDA